VISDLWWLQLNAAPLYEADHFQPEKAFYTPATSQSMANWIESAYAHQVTQFDLVTLNYALPRELIPLLPQHTLTILELIQVDNLLVFRLAIH
jgi:hypothetical protein